MHIIKRGGKYARKQERVYAVKATGTVFVGIILFFLLYNISERWILVLISFGFGVHYFRRSRHWSKGIQSEKIVVEALTSLDNSYVLINDVILPGKKSNIDHIIVGPNGVFVIETKSYKLHYLNRFSIKQVVRNAVSLRYFLKEHLQLDIFIPAILVSTESNANINQNFPNVYITNLRNYVIL